MDPNTAGQTNGDQDRQSQQSTMDPNTAGQTTEYQDRERQCRSVFGLATLYNDTYLSSDNSNRHGRRAQRPPRSYSVFPRLELEASIEKLDQASEETNDMFNDEIEDKMEVCNTTSKPEAEIDELETTADKEEGLQEAYDKLKAQHEESLMDNRGLKASLDKERAENNESVLELQEKLHKLNETLMETRAFQTVNQSLRASLDEAHDKKADQVVELLKKVENLEAYYDQASRRSFGLQIEVRTLETSLDNERAENNTLHAKNGELHAENIESNAKYEELRVEKDDLQAKYDDMHAEINKSNAKYEELRVKKDKLTSKYDVLHAKNIESNAKYEELRVEKDNLQNTHNQLHAVNRRFEADCDKLRLKNINLEVKNSVLDKEILDSRNRKEYQIKTLTNQRLEAINKNREDAAAARSQVDDLTAHVHRLENRIETLTAQNERLAGINKNHEETNTRLARIETMMAENTALTTKTLASVVTAQAVNLAETDLVNDNVTGRVKRSS